MDLAKGMGRLRAEPSKIICLPVPVAASRHEVTLASIRRRDIRIGAV